MPVHAKKITLVAPSMRHERLGAVAMSIAAARVPAGWTLDWKIRFMPPKILREDIFSPIRDDLLWSIRDGFWYYLSDDNLLHPDLPAKVAEIVESRSEPVNCIMFGQRHERGVRTATFQNLEDRQLGADGGQFVISGFFYAANKLRYHEFGLEERELFKHIHNLDPSRFVFCNEVLTFRDAQLHDFSQK